MATNNNPNSTKFQTLVQKVSDGLGNNVAPLVTSFPLLGTTYSRTEVISKLKALLVIYVAAATTRDAYRAAVVAKRAASVSGRAFVEAVIAFLKLTLGPNAQAALSSLGIAPPKVRKAASAETKAIAKAKASATRKARGIMGKKQRSTITANPQPTFHVLDGTGQPLSTPVASSPQAVAPASPAKT